MAARLHLLIPGLFGPLAADATPYCPQLEYLLSRGDFHRAPAAPLPTHLAQLFGLPALPAGPVCRAALAETDAGDGLWFRADPVQLLVGQNNIYLLAWEELALREEESAALITALNEFHRDDGWQWRALDPQRWLVRIPAPFDLVAEPTTEVMQRDLREATPGGADARRWRGRLAELEMLLHSHPVNQARAAAGQPVANSLWLWGGGAQPPQVGRPFAHIIGGDCLLRGLAALGGADYRPSADVETVLTLAVDAALVQPTDLRLAVRRTDLATWTSGVEVLERAWFAPLVGALRTGRLDELVIDGAGPVLRINRTNLRRWWRRHRPLNRWCRS